MKSSNVFLKAAQKLDLGGVTKRYGCYHSCCTVAEFAESGAEVEWYAKKFGIGKKPINEDAVRIAAMEAGMTLNDFRVMLLCMAAAVSATEAD